MYIDKNVNCLKIPSEAGIELNLYCPMEQETYYYDDEPVVINMGSNYTYVQMVILPVTGDKQIGLVMTPKQAKQIAKIIKKMSKEARRKNK